MANNSFVFGDISISASSLNDLAVFVYYFNKVNYPVEYYTSLNQLKDAKNFNDVLNIIKNNHHVVVNDDNIQRYKFNSSFDAAGRWSFKRNLEWFFDLEDYKNEIDTLSDNGYDKLIESIEIEVDYTENEGGCAFIDEANAYVRAIKNEHGEYKSNIDINHNYSNYTIDNLKTICGYTNVYSINDVLNNMSDYFTEDALNNHKTEIINSLNTVPVKNRDFIYFDLYDMFDELNVNIDHNYLI